ncbi:hypothetical protein CC86DRAFT_412426 [Ophiobolus disseminans]|uniref:Uncharacterized protein n=1 Tax=Ophiobolus disseminans TaxID=1469910 RepID=A0A6A6ZG31_9PLEO|nr:hypothetical protein CC86DRAFT_412426 [Ophiobolus disseminans]
MSSSSSSYGSYAQANKGAYTSRPSTSSTTYTTASSSSRYAQSGHSSRNKGYGSKPPVIHNGGGQTYDPNTSSSVPNGSYHT